MRQFVSGLAAIMLASSAASAQAPAQEGFIAREVRLPLGTTIPLALDTQLNSTDNRVGDLLSLTVLDDIRIEDQIVIPRGTRAAGEIIWRTGRGVFGKTGKMDIAMRYIDLNGTRFPVEGVFRQHGRSATAAIVATAMAGGVLTSVITGGSARIPAGQRISARTAYAIPFMIPGGQIAPSYDAAAAFAAVQPTEMTRRSRGRD